MQLLLTKSEDGGFCLPATFWHYGWKWADENSTNYFTKSRQSLQFTTVSRTPYGTADMGGADSLWYRTNKKEMFLFKIKLQFLVEPWYCLFISFVFAFHNTALKSKTARAVTKQMRNQKIPRIRTGLWSVARTELQKVVSHSKWQRQQQRLRIRQFQNTTFRFLYEAFIS